MKDGCFCFLSNKYYTDFPDSRLMKNKELVDGSFNKRPFFLVFCDTKNKNIRWVVPISSRHDKYTSEYKKKVKKYGKCNTIRFGEVLGRNAAFLIQNMCPVTNDYIEEVYVNKNNELIQIDNRIVDDVISNAREVLAKQLRGANIIFPDVMVIYNNLVEQTNQHATTQDAMYVDGIGWVDVPETNNNQKQNEKYPIEY